MNCTYSVAGCISCYRPLPSRRSATEEPGKVDDQTSTGKGAHLLDSQASSDEGTGAGDSLAGSQTSSDKGTGADVTSFK